MAGEWQAVRTAPQAPKIKSEAGDSTHVLNVGVRKRKQDEADEEDEATGQILSKKKTWGSTLKSHSDLVADSEDLDALFPAKRMKADLDANTIKAEGTVVKNEPTADVASLETADSAPAAVKSETNVETAPNDVKQEEHSASPVIFKKRKSKATKPK